MSPQQENQEPNNQASKMTTVVLEDHDHDVAAAATAANEEDGLVVGRISPNHSSSSSSPSSNGCGRNDHDEENPAAAAAGSQPSSLKSPPLEKGSSFIAAVGVIDRDIPIVELELKNVTYAPITASVAAQKNKRNLFRRRRRGDATTTTTATPENSTTTTSTTRTIVLKNVTTKISPYKLTAWMGPSGSGKTSLISVTADLISSKDDLRKGSTIKVNGTRGRIPKRLIGCVWQDDLLLSNLTVEENIYYSARLKTPERTYSNNDVHQIVEETMKDLGLWHVRNSLVGGGNPTGGTVVGSRASISGGERKRVAVASELVVRPSLLLLDEPTSGLDATTAYALIETLQQLASVGGHSIVVVIHQPRTAIYNMFDHLLLLSKGRVVYDGLPSMARSYLESCPSVTPLPPETGIGDWIMDVITTDERSDEPSLANHWEDECNNDFSHVSSRSAGNDELVVSKKEQQQQQCQQSRKLSRRMSSLDELRSGPKFNVSFGTQFKLLTKRTMKQNRGERLTATACLLQFAYLFFTALFWWQMPDNTNWIYERTSLLFFMLVAQANGICITAVTVFHRERALVSRERAKSMYGVASYFLGKIVSDMTNNVLLPVLYGMVVYWTANFRGTLVAYLQFILAFYMVLSTAQSMGLFLSVAIKNTQVSLVLAPPITLFFMIMGGFYIPFSNMHPGVEWLSWLSFARYGYSALVINEFAGRDIPCALDDERVAAAVAVSGVSDGGVGSVCPVTGDEVVSGIGIYGVAESYWFNTGMLIVFQIVFRVLAYMLLRRLK